MNADILIVGGGLAGLAAATALGSAGLRVELLERRPILGGRAASWEVPGTEATIDNCQHLLLGCCTNLVDFYKRFGVAGQIRWFNSFHLRTLDGRESMIAASLLPEPLHLSPSLVAFHAMSWADRFAISRGMLALIADLRGSSPAQLDSETMRSWLNRHGQTHGAIEAFWRPVLTSALNEDLEICSAWHGLRVFWKGYAANWRAYRIGLPAIGLTELYAHEMPNVTVRFRSNVTAVEADGNRVTGVCLANGENFTAENYVLALPFEILGEMRPEYKLEIGHSPITGIHLWFDRVIMERPMTAMLGRTIQWVFRKPGDDCYLQCVVSASRSLLNKTKGEIVEMAVRELGEFFPQANDASLVKSAVVKEVRATFSPAVGVEKLRPDNATKWPNAWLAGDWTNTGWPATMESAVRSGYRAAELITAKLGRPQTFLVPDLAAEGLARFLGVP